MTSSRQLRIDATVTMFFVAVLLACALVFGSGVLPSQSGQPNVAHAATHATQCKDVAPQIKRWLKPVLTYFSVHICYDGSRVWTTRVDCNLFSWAGTASNTWCGTSVNNSSYVEFGNNYQFIPLNSMGQIFGYNRFQYNANGNYVTNYGN
jgi:hypothetical protein